MIQLAGGSELCCLLPFPSSHNIPFKSLEIRYFEPMKHQTQFVGFFILLFVQYTIFAWCETFSDIELCQLFSLKGRMRGRDRNVEREKERIRKIEWHTGTKSSSIPFLRHCQKYFRLSCFVSLLSPYSTDKAI